MLLLSKLGRRILQTSSLQNRRNAFGTPRRAGGALLGMAELQRIAALAAWGESGEGLFQPRYLREGCQQFIRQDAVFAIFRYYFQPGLLGSNGLLHKVFSKCFNFSICCTPLNLSTRTDCEYLPAFYKIPSGSLSSALMFCFYSLKCYSTRATRKPSSTAACVLRAATASPMRKS